MKRSVVLSDEHIKLISRFRINEFSSTRVGLDYYDLYGGGFLINDMALILGCEVNQIVDNIDSNGYEYDKETEKRLTEMSEYIDKNIVYIEEIVHQFSIKGGLKPGKYVCDEAIHIWEFKEN